MLLFVVSIRNGINVLVPVFLVFFLVILEAFHERAIVTLGLPISIRVVRCNPDSFGAKGCTDLLKELRLELGTFLCYDQGWYSEREEPRVKCGCGDIVSVDFKAKTCANFKYRLVITRMLVFPLVVFRNGTSRSISIS